MHETPRPVVNSDDACGDVIETEERGQIMRPASSEDIAMFHEASKRTGKK